ncbi:MAG: LysR substrate-binding domain-containing protein [Georgfuchsia sp.]
MELRHLRYFVAVAEELSFRRAALRLQVSQPPVSNRIADLERELGVKLFSRQQRQIQLTRAGQAFLDEARATLFQANRAVSVAQSVGRGEISRIRIGYNRYTSYELLPWFLRLLNQHYPDVEPVPVMAPLHEILRGLEMDKLDIGLARTPIFSHLLDWKVMLPDCLAAVVPSDHTLAKQGSIPLTSLRNETFIVLGQKFVGAYANLVVSAWQSAGFSPTRIEEVDSLPAMLAMVAIRRGVGLIAKTLMEEQVWPDVSVLELTDVEIHSDLVVVWRKDESASNCRNLIEHIQTTQIELDPFSANHRS